MHGVASNSLRDESGHEKPEHIRSLLLEDFFTQATAERAGFPRWIRVRFLNSMKGRDGEPAISTVNDLLALSELQFKGYPGIGRKAFTYVRVTLAEQGLAFGSSARA